MASTELIPAGSTATSTESGGILVSKPTDTTTYSPDDRVGAEEYLRSIASRLTAHVPHPGADGKYRAGDLAALVSAMAFKDTGHWAAGTDDDDEEEGEDDGDISVYGEDGEKTNDGEKEEAEDAVVDALIKGDVEALIKAEKRRADSPPQDTTPAKTAKISTE